MTVTLPKGGNLLLTDEAPGITRVRVGVGWNPGPVAAGAPLEMDVVVSIITETAPGGRLLLGQQVPNPEEPVGTRPVSGPIVGDVEKLVVNLEAAPRSLTRLVFGVAIYDAVQRRQTFRPVRDAYIRVLNDENGVEVARYTLEPETGAETAMVFGELYRNPKGWKFRAVGQGYSEGLRGVAGSGAAEPAIARPVDVTGFLTRASATRNRRSAADHLHPPPLPAAPPAKAASRPPATASPPVKATPPVKAAQPSSSSSSPSPPRRGLTPPPRPAAAPPARPTPPSPPQSRPAPPAKASPPRAPARSSLDLSGPEPTPDAGASDATVQTSRPSSRVVFGEHSSRHRQRQERVPTLDDDHPVTTWTEQDRGAGGMTITLQWEPLTTASRLPRPSDIQLGGFWQAGDRAAGVMQTLGNAISAPGLLGPRQVLRLGRRDEREGQTIFVDLAALQEFRRFFVFAYGLHGSPEWEALRPELVVTAPSGETLSMRLGAAPPSARICVIASFHISADDLVIRRENDFLDGTQSHAAARYGWALEWNPDGMSLRT
ncbi:MAG TPA: TerD family protein [Frankiaceae bacterium]|nr:TerD family protein [Frankiaceae bacterium]